MRKIRFTRSTLLSAVHHEGVLDGMTSEDVAKKTGCGYSDAQVLLALKIFEQLSLVSFDSGRLKVIRGVKKELSDSDIYNKHYFL